MLKALAFIVGQLRGTATNDSAVAGNVGEYVTASLVSGSAIGLTTATPANVTSISLTAGDWDVSGVVDFVPAATTNVGQYLAGSNTTSATFGPQDTFTQDIFAAQTPTAGPVCRIAPTTRYSLSATTTVFLVAQSTFITSTMTAYGTIRARRIR